MKKLNFLGIGPKIAVVLLPWLAASIVASSFKIRVLKYSSECSKFLLIAGIVLMAAGLIFYFSTVKMLLKGLKETKLMTKGPYSLCQNPLYASLILAVIPALSLILNSWLILTSSLIGYILFKRFISAEYIELEKFFGEEYIKYKTETPEFFPLPRKSI
jgi:protein-S-isoprenylcysteine O-methyltransferase Ste14